MEIEILRELLDGKKYLQFKDEIKNVQEADIAELLEKIKGKNLLLAFRLLPKIKAAGVFSHLSSDKQIELAELVNVNELVDILDDLFFDDKVDFIEEMPANAVKKILQKTSYMERRLINQFLKYPENSAGSLMTIEYVDLKKEMLVKDALERIRRIAQDKETIYTCYVTDAQRRLDGLISLKDLVLASQNEKVEDVMHTDYIYVDTYDDQEKISELFKKYDLLAVPVVDMEKRLVGIITIDDIVDVIEMENTEDFYRMAAIQPGHEEYINAGVFTLASRRILWLSILMISAMLMEYIIHRYESTLVNAVVLTAFIPMLMGTGGNSGAQASTLVIRSLVLGEIEFKDIFRVMWKEMRVSIIVGILLAAANFIRLIAFKNDFDVAVTVSITLFFIVIVAKIFGGMLPIIVKKAKLDPALIASPVITTIVDAVSLIIYFYIASSIINV